MLKNKIDQTDFYNAQKYLDEAGTSYLNLINGNTLDSLKFKTQELVLLVKHIPNPKVIVSVGVGEGEEVHALFQIYRSCNPKIIGIDISSLAVKSAKERMSRYGIPARFVISSATNLPFENESVDIIVFSSVLHEIYSYLPQSKESWNKSIQEAARVLSERGCLYIKDPAAPKIAGSVKINFLSDLAGQFYDYFRKEFRVFSTWTPTERSKIIFKRQPNENDFPSRENNTVVLPMIKAAELMLHFRNFLKDYQKELVHIGDIDWKEINETYYVSFQVDGQGKNMSTDLYIREILKQGNSALKQTLYKLICVENVLTPRVNSDVLLSSHFLFTLLNKKKSNQKTSKKLIRSTINKMQLVFQKIKK